MRKKWTYVAIVSMMLGVAPVFTGCVDTDEPAGLENLRGAKADLLRAKAAVQEALAKVEEANARYRDQETAWLKAKTDYETQVAREKELMNDLLEAQNEIEKQKAEAAYQAYLEELARQKELLDAQLAADLKEAEADMMQAEINLETLRQELELAKISGTEATQATIAALQADVEAAYVKLYGGTETITIPGSFWRPGEVKENEVIGAIQEYYYAKKAEQEAMAYQAQGFDCKIEKQDDGSYKVTPKKSGSNWTGTLAAYVEEAQADLEAAQQLLTDLETYGDKEVEGTDWKAEVAKLQAEIDKLEQDLSVQLAQLDQAHATPEYLAALQAVEGVWKEDESFDKGKAEKDEENITWKKEVVKVLNETTGKEEDKDVYYVCIEDGATQILYKAEQALIDKQEEKLFSYDEFKAATEVSEDMKKAIVAAAEELNEEADKDVYEYPDEGFAYEGSTEDFAWGTQTKDNKTIASTLAQKPTNVQNILDNLNNWIAMVDRATIDPNEVGQAQAMLTRAKKEQEAAEKAYDGAKKNWENLVNIVTNAKSVSVSTVDLKKSTDNYSEAFTTLNNAITAWNNEVDKAYQAAYDAAEAEWEFELQQDAISGVTVTAFDKSAFQTEWNSLKALGDDEYITPEQFARIIDKHCGTGTAAAEVSEAVWTQIDAYVDYQKKTDPTNRKAQLVSAGKNAVTEGNVNYFDKKKNPDTPTYKERIEQAGKDLAVAVWSKEAGENPTTTPLDQAIKDFNADATDYVQVPTKEAKAAQAINVLIGKADKDGKFSGFTDSEHSSYYTASAADATTGKIKYTINVTDITDTEIDNATKTQFDTTDGAGEKALSAMSIRVFGIDEARYTEPSRETIEADVEENKDKPVGVDNEGQTITYEERYKDSFAGQLFAANDVVEGYQNQIDASDDLEALQKELEAALAAFEKTINDQYTANFGALETAITDANADLAKKQETLDEQEAKYTDIEVAIAKLQAQIAAEKDLLYTLQSAAWKYLNITWPTTEDGETIDNVWTDENKLYDPEKFAEDLQKAIQAQKLVVADKERLVALAQAEYDKAAATGYNGVDLATLYVEAAAAKRKTAEEAYTRALEALQRALDVLSGSEAEQPEQPAE